MTPSAAVATLDDPSSSTAGDVGCLGAVTTASAPNRILLIVAKGP